MEHSKTTQPYTLFTGVDISSQTAEAAWGTSVSTVSQAQTFKQNRDGHRALIKALQVTGHDPARILVVIEATGTYWMRLATSMYQAGFAVSVINPRQAYHFALALLKQAKTDAIDAQTLAQLAATLQPDCWQPPTAAWEALYQRLVERDNLVGMRQMIRNQLHALCQRTQIDPEVENRKHQLLDHIQCQIDTIDRQLEDWLRKSEWVEMAERLRSIKGIGLISAAWLLVITNGFTTCEDAEQLVSYLGLAPHPLQSGTTRSGYRRIGHGGHARARRVLYQASVSAARTNPIVKTFYDRLIANGKHVKVARCAATRKLVHIACAVVSKEQMFDPHYQQSYQQVVVA